MRAIFLLLLLSNLSVFGYYVIFPKEVVPADVGAAMEAASDAKPGLLLLSERGLQAASSSAQKSSLERKPSASVEQELAAPLCTMIGPYDRLLQAEYAVEIFSSLGGDAHIVPVEIKEGELFWVYLQPEISEREAINRLYELQRKNIESYVISKGELTNGISFGRFSTLQEAENRAKKINEIGYDAQIKIMPKTIQETWVVLSRSFAEKVGDSVWLSLLDKQKGLERRQNFCLGVASE